MKKLLNIAAAVALLFGVSTAAHAQDIDEYYPHNFISVQGGAQATLTHYDFMDLVTPQFAISAGRFFNPKVGARLHFQGYETKGGFLAERFPGLPNGDADYKFKAITGDLDLLMNMSNIISPNRASQRFNWLLIAGFGVNYGWDFDEYKCIVADMTKGNNFYVGPEQCGTKHSSFNGRLGTQFEYCFSPNFGVNLELDANYKNDCYNLKANFDPDWQIAALVGLTFKFGMKKKAAPVVVAPPVEPVVMEEPKPEPKPEPKVEPKPEPKPQPKPEPKMEPLRETFFYAIRESDPDPETTLNKIVAWCEKYPEGKIIISGYADRGTGNPQINVGYAKARAEKVAKQLEQRGISKSRMTVESFGDKVQPFDENDRNRCVIVVGK